MADILYKYGMKLIPKGNHSLQFRKPKMEIGTVATDWSPAPEDPDADLLERINVLQTDFQVVQGEIQAKVWETDIEKATDGLYESMNEMYAYIDETINGISAEVGDLTFTVENNYYTLTEQISDLVITTDSITGMVRDTQQTMETYYDELTGDIVNSYNTTMELIASLQIEADNITATVSNVQTTLNDVLIGANIFLHTSKIDMDRPFTASGSTPSSFEVVEGTLLPAGENYLIVAPGSYNSSGGYANFGYYWTVNNNIIFDNADRLIEGNTYTVSCYVLSPTARTVYFYIDRLAYGQEILNVSHEISSVEGTRSVSNTTARLVELTFDGTGRDWQRVWVTFKCTAPSSFRTYVEFMYDSYCRDIRMCGQMLNEGDTVLVWDDGESGRYATTAYVSSQLEILAGSITLSVDSATNGSASIILTVDGKDVADNVLYSEGLRKAFADDTTAVIISAGTITFNSNTFIVNSTYFSVTATGVITATSGTIGGWTIGGTYLFSGPTSLTSATAGTILVSGTAGGLRNNGSTRGIAMNDGQLLFYYGSTQVSSIVCGSSTDLSITASKIDFRGDILAYGSIYGPYQSTGTVKEALSGRVRAVAYHDVSTGTIYWIYLTFYGGLLQEVSTSYSGAWTEYSI